jgi:hypothetical protein
MFVAPGFPRSAFDEERLFDRELGGIQNAMQAGPTALRARSALGGKTGGS